MRFVSNPSAAKGVFTTALVVLVMLVMVTGGCGGSPESSSVDSAESAESPDAATGSSWPRWGGSSGDFKVAAGALAATWPEPPAELWSRELGPGYSAVVVDRGVAVTQYRDGDQDVVIALRADDGSQVWEQRYDAPTHEGNTLRFGKGPNATPLILGDRVITLGYTGILGAWNMESGESLWQHDLIADFDGEVLQFGYSASPIEHDGKIIVLVGGNRGAVAAMDPDNGELAWRSAGGTVSYATPIVIDVDGQEQIVYFSADEILGLEAATGRSLWSHPCENQYSNNATDPIWNGDGLLWVATQLDGGTRLLKLSSAGGETAVEEVWSNGKISIHHWNAMRLDDHVYASIGSNASILAAIHLPTGEIVWRERGFEQANFVQAGDKTLILGAGGDLALVTLTPEGVTVHGRHSIVDEVTWTPPTLVGTTLFVRDQSSIRALDLGS